MKVTNKMGAYTVEIDGKVIAKNLSRRKAKQAIAEFSKSVVSQFKENEISYEQACDLISKCSKAEAALY